MLRRSWVKIIVTVINKVWIFGKKVDDFTEEEINNIKEKMNELIKQDLKIDEVNLSYEEALNYFKSINHLYSVL